MARKTLSLQKTVRYFAVQAEFIEHWAKELEMSESDFVRQCIDEAMNNRGMSLTQASRAKVEPTREQRKLRNNV
jgi:hypothetical protein